VQAQKLHEVFAVLKPDQSVATVAVTPDIYDALVRDFDHFRAHSLVSVYEFSAPWTSWERHPAGDEVVVLLSGQARFRIRTSSGEDSVTLAGAGTYIVVPRNAWHTAETTEATRLLFITPGEARKTRTLSMPWTDDRRRLTRHDALIPDGCVVRQYRRALTDRGSRRHMTWSRR